MLNPINKTIELGDGRTITIETGKLAKQADGAVTVRMGNTVLLATVCAAKDANPGVDFMPLQVEYKEKFSAFGRFPGGFTKREGKASDYEILTARLVDRALRPLFPDDYHAETFVQATLYSADEESTPGCLAGLAASAVTARRECPCAIPSGSASRTLPSPTKTCAPRRRERRSAFRARSPTRGNATAPKSFSCTSARRRRARSGRAENCAPLPKCLCAPGKRRPSACAFRAPICRRTTPCAAARPKSRAYTGCRSVQTAPACGWRANSSSKAEKAPRRTRPKWTPPTAGRALRPFPTRCSNA